jgi:hypothetical protein
LTTSDITTTVTGSAARALLTRARFTQDQQGRWSAPDGRWTWATDEALTWALDALAEHDDNDNPQQGGNQ